MVHEMIETHLHNILFFYDAFQIVVSHDYSSENTNESQKVKNYNNSQVFHKFIFPIGRLLA
jgi:hypothetical protein